MTFSLFAAMIRARNTQGGNPMNLKEAFRFQNKLRNLQETASVILGCDSNVTQVKQTYLRKKVMPEAEN